MADVRRLGKLEESTLWEGIVDGGGRNGRADSLPQSANGTCCSDRF